MMGTHRNVTVIHQKSYVLNGSSLKYSPSSVTKPSAILIKIELPSMSAHQLKAQPMSESIRSCPWQAQFVHFYRQLEEVVKALALRFGFCYVISPYVDAVTPDLVQKLSSASTHITRIS